jgi:hypothetical protein
VKNAVSTATPCNNPGTPVTMDLSFSFLCLQLLHMLSISFGTGDEFEVIELTY